MGLGEIVEEAGEEDDDFERNETDDAWAERLQLCQRLVDMGTEDLPEGDSFAARSSRNWHRSVVHAATMALEAETECVAEEKRQRKASKGKGRAEEEI